MAMKRLPWYVMLKMIIYLFDWRVRYFLNDAAADNDNNDN